MVVTELLTVAILSGSLSVAADIRHFPGSYFDTHVRVPYQQDVMRGWPGPGRLLEIWNGETLSEDERVAWLVGAAVFHDPLLLPAYEEAVHAESQRIRQAAVYGYRDLIADRVPDVRGGIDDETAEHLRREIRLVARTLRRNSLQAFWLQSLLVHDGGSFPWWSGIHLERPRGDCAGALERLVDEADLGLLVEAYGLSENKMSRISLMKLIEGVTLSRFIVKPTGVRHGWGSFVYDDGLSALERALRLWSRDSCAVDGETVLRSNLRGIGAGEIDPASPESCSMWLEIIKRGKPSWWMLAAKRLYACGGPWFELSSVNPDSQRNSSARDELLKWYEAPPPRRQPERPYVPK